MWSWIQRLFQRPTPSPSGPPQQGTVKRIIRDRGFGFIRSSDGKEIFFHRSALVGLNMGSLSEGQKVEFQLQEGPKGPRATNVRAV